MYLPNDMAFGNEKRVCPDIGRNNVFELSEVFLEVMGIANCCPFTAKHTNKFIKKQIFKHFILH